MTGLEAFDSSFHSRYSREDQELDASQKRLCEEMASFFGKDETVNEADLDLWATEELPMAVEEQKTAPTNGVPLAAETPEVHDIVDGFVIDSQGEIIGVVEKPELRIDNPGSAEWLLRKISECDAALLAIDARRAALIANIDQLEAVQQQRRRFFEWKWGNELIEFARTQLTGRKKTYTTPFGSVSFRKTQPRIEIDDMEAAVEWIKKTEPKLVHTKETVLVSEIADVVHSNDTKRCGHCDGIGKIAKPDELGMSLCTLCGGSGTVSELPRGVFKVINAGEKSEIKTGVGKQK